MALRHAECKRIDHAVQIREAGIRHAACRHAQRGFRVRERTWHRNAEQSVFVPIGHVLFIQFHALHLHSGVEREHQLRLGREAQRERSVHVQRRGRFDGDLRVQPQEVRRRGVSLGNVGVAPRLPFVFGGNDRLPQDGDTAEACDDQGESTEQGRRSRCAVGSGIAGSAQRNEASAEQHLRAARQGAIHGEEARRHVRSESVEAGKHRNHRQQTQRRVQQQPNVGAQKRQPKHDRSQPIARDGCQQQHDGAPQHQRWRRIHEQERGQRPRLHRPQPSVQDAAAQPLVRRQAGGLKGRCKHRAHQPHGHHKGCQPAEEEREIANRPRIQHLDHAGGLVAVAVIEGEEDDAGQERQQEASGVPGHQKASGHDVAGVVAHRIVLERRVVVEDEGSPASSQGQQRQDPCSGCPANAAQFQQGDGERVVQ